MDNNEKIHLLFDTTEQLQISIAEQIKELQTKIEHLESAGGNLQKVVKAAIIESMNGTVGTAKNAVNDALSPAMQSINGTINAASRADDKLNDTVKQLGWKMALMAGGVVGALLLTAYLALWWQRSELEAINANIASQNALKGQINVKNCGGNPCVEVDTIAPVWGGESKNIYILKGVRFK
jgi:hypothetical protein